MKVCEERKSVIDERACALNMGKPKPHVNWRLTRTAVIQGMKTGVDPEDQTKYYLSTNGSIWGPEFDTKEAAFAFLRSNFKRLRCAD